jgi:hypothetical protein
VSCRATRARLSAYLDRDLPPLEAQRVAAHLAGCAGCVGRFRSLQRAVELLGELPLVENSESIASRVLDRLELESRGPGLALLFRPIGSARPLILPSLIPAALVLVTILVGALALDHKGTSAWERGWGTEADPVFPSGGVSAPRIRERGPADDVLAGMGEGTLFLETVVARDGSVSNVTLLAGDSRTALPLLEALRKDRFEPGRFAGRPVAVSVYRLISRMDVWARIT